MRDNFPDGRELDAVTDPDALRALVREARAECLVVEGERRALMHDSARLIRALYAARDAIAAAMTKPVELRDKGLLKLPGDDDRG